MWAFGVPLLFLEAFKMFINAGTDGGSSSSSFDFGGDPRVPWLFIGPHLECLRRLGGLEDGAEPHFINAEVHWLVVRYANLVEKLKKTIETN